MSDTTTHLGIPKPNRARVPALNVDEEFDQLALAWDTVDAFLHALAQTVALLAPAEHEQAMSTIIGLVDALNAKMPADRQFSLDDLTDVDGAADAPVNWILVKGSSGKFVPSTALAALGVHPHLISEVTGLVAALNDRPTRTEVSEALDLLEADMTAEILKRGVPLGTMVHSAVPLESQGFLLADGSPCTPTTPDLRAALLAGGSPFGHNGVDPLLPNELTGNRFRRAAGGSLALGTVQGDAIRNITGGIENPTTLGTTHAGATDPSGAFYKKNIKSIGYNTSTVGSATWDLGFDASRVVPTADENRPKSIAYLPYIKAFGAVTIEGMADAAALFSALATKPEAEAGADNTKLMTALRAKEAIAAQVPGVIAARARYDIGSYAMAFRNTTGVIAAGDIVAGSNLIAMAFRTSQNPNTPAAIGGTVFGGVASADAMPGSWMLCGSAASNDATYSGGLWKRIS